MEHIKFSLFFVLSHVLSYLIAGVIALKISKDIYESRKRLCSFLRDMSNKEESLHVSRYFMPAQILRGFLMSIVLYPFIYNLVEFSFMLKFLFFSGLMFIYTHIAATSPFIDNIEGYVYFKSEYLKKKAILKFQLEMILYSILFGLIISFFIDFLF
ncbi:hypothetical protein [Senegalia massiliensis]|uniref:Uncharacterized protein n=1 Tax=Senegalia massiliensis TaxID=1720316 RepID=A0A845QVP2_9CLOT|nr:hypothetical protein [Senegalia massiliensis]NBI05576.1 hypothetical protein [Senegalia massiliensis]